MKFHRSSNKSAIKINLNFIILLLFFLIPAIIPNRALSAPPLILEEGKGKYPLGHHLDILEDKEGNWTFEEISSPSFVSKWTPNKVKVPNFSFSDSVYWLRLSVQSEFSYPSKWLLEIAFPLHDYLDVYIPNAQNDIDIYKTGDRRPFNTRPIEHRNFVFELKFDGEENKTIYLRFQTWDGLHEAIPAILWEPDTFSQTDTLETVVYGFYFGILFVLIAYNLFIFFSVRDYSYIWYVLFIIFFLMWNGSFSGFSFHYLWPQNHYWANKLILIFAVLFIVFLGIFTLSYLKTKKYAPKIHYSLLIVTVINALIAILGLYGIYALSFLIFFIINPIAAPLIFLASIFSLRAGYNPARYYILSFILLLCGGVFYSLKMFGILPSNLLTERSLQIGAVLQVTFLAFGLADRINQERKSKEIAQKEALRNEILAREAQEKAIDNLKKYQQIFDNAFEGIFQASYKGRLINVNKSFAKIFGYDSPEELLSANLNISKQCFIHFEDAMKFDKILREKGQVENFVGQGLRRDNSIFWASLSGRAIYEGQGKIFHYEGSMVDITERKEKERAEKEREKAEATTKAKTEFLATMSHEIRTPMNSILGMTYLLSETSLSYEQNDFVGTISASGELLLSVINDILDFSKIEAGQIELEKTVFDLTDLAETSGKILSVKAHEKGLDLSCRVAPDVQPFRIGDPTRLRQIIINLLSNAIKFTEQGKVMLEVVNSDELDVLNFCVKDTGIGIPVKKQQSIFDSFSQADTSTTRKFGGTGLGLAICKRLVELMDGRIWIESEEGKGTRFFFTARFPETDQIPESAVELARDLKTVKKYDEITLPPIHILMAEDIASNQKIMKLYLKDTPVTMDIAENGKIAVEKFTINTYDIVMMDIEMPEMDGLEATRVIRKWEHDNKKDKTPIIALTAHAFDEQMKKCFDVGCNGFLPKPVKKKDVVATLGELFKEKICDSAVTISDNNAAGKIFSEDLSTDMKFKVRINADLEELMPDLFNEINEETGNINRALEKDDFELINRLGHGFKGATATYGLDDLSKIFLKIENGAKSQNKETVIDNMTRVTDYIANVEIEYIRE